MDAITDSPGRNRPLSRKYDTIENRGYKFFKNSASCMQMYYPLIKNETGNHVSRVAHQLFDASADDSHIQEIPEEGLSIDCLPDEVLLVIFSYIHPVDLIHRLSLVSQRWNNVANRPSLLTEVRVLVNYRSLALGSVKGFFARNAQALRKLCIECSVALPSAQVNELFDNRIMPNVTHLDISSFEGMDPILLGKLSQCFPNLETLHMEGLRECASFTQREEKWREIQQLLFENEDTFPKLQNFFIGDLDEFWNGSDEKLLAWKRPLKVLHIQSGATRMNFRGITTSPWRTTLTELYLGCYIMNRDFRYIGLLENLKVFSLDLCLYTADQDLMHLKNLCNVEEFRLACGDQDCNLTVGGMVSLFKLPEKEPEKFFPYKLKNLALTELQICRTEVLKVIAESCPNLRTLNVQRNEFMGIEAMQFIVKNFKKLVLLDLSDIGEYYFDDIWDQLGDDDLPNLRFLRVQNNEAEVEYLQRLNLKRPKLLITYKLNHFINWTEYEDGSVVFHDSYDGDINSLMNDLCQVDGFGCCGAVTHFPPAFMYQGPNNGYMVRSSSQDTSGIQFPRDELSENPSSSRSM